MNFKPWRCLHCGKVIGAVRRNSSRVPVLYVLDGPVDDLDTDFNWTNKMLAGDVRCSCGKIRNWRSVRG